MIIGCSLSRRVVLLLSLCMRIFQKLGPIKRSCVSCAEDPPLLLSSCGHIRGDTCGVGHSLGRA